MAEKEPWFVEERAIAFASLLLTSRDDLAIRQQPGAGETDLLVEILENGKPTMRLFGVRLKGCVALPDATDTERMFSANGTKDRSRYNLPLCAFLIDVKKNEGSYAWLVEPTLHEGKPRLVWSAESDWKPLDEVALQTIIDQVTEWYEPLRPART